MMHAGTPYRVRTYLRVDNKGKFKSFKTWRRAIHCFSQRVQILTMQRPVVTLRIPDCIRVTVRVLYEVLSTIKHSSTIRGNISLA
jgi:hypothetical protein